MRIIKIYEIIAFNKKIAVYFKGNSFADDILGGFGKFIQTSFQITYYIDLSKN